MTNKQWTNLIGGLLVAVLIIGGIYTLSRSGAPAAGDNLAQVEGGDDLLVTDETATREGLTADSAPTGARLMMVKIALLKEGGAAGASSCDLPVLVDRLVPVTTMPLNVSLKALCADQSPWPYDALGPGNFVSHRSGLKFAEATLDKGVARVYLTGELGALSGVCDGPRLRTQVEATARQFPSVGAVEVYLNDARWTEPSLK